MLMAHCSVHHKIHDIHTMHIEYTIDCVFQAVHGIS
jgi:hypothetical protein